MRALSARNLVRNAPFPIDFSRIDDGIILYLNPQAARKLTVSRTYILGKSTQAFYVNPRGKDQLIAQLLQQGFLQHREVRLRTAAGELFWANLSATLIQFEDQLAVFFAIIDISERRPGTASANPGHNRRVDRALQSPPFHPVRHRRGGSRPALQHAIFAADAGY